MIERKIIISLITSTEYFKKIRPVIDSKLLESSTARLLTNWCIQHFDEYKKAPGKEIETLFFKKVKDGLDKEIAEEIEEDILPDLSDESENEEIDIEYTYKETVKYLQSRQYIIHSEQIQNIFEKQGNFEDKLKEANQLKQSFKSIQQNEDESIDLSTPKALKRIKKAFEDTAKPIIEFPKELGQFWNSQFVPGGFISFLAPEKRGKSFWLLEIAMRAARQGRKVAFFQAGDMNEAEQLKRISIYLNRRSNLEKYCDVHYEAVKDCYYNQMNTCNKPERECDFAPWDAEQVSKIGKMGINEFKEALETNYDYDTCYNCKDYVRNKYGVPWIKKNEKVEPITYKDANEKVKEFFHKYKRHFKLDTYANGTLSVDGIISKLDYWEEQGGFIADLIIIDYSDLLIADIKEERHKQNQVWKDLRKLSQTKRQDILPLVISPTQADGKSYKQYRLQLDNYSEDKRKYGHATAFYGLNLDPGGIEKGLGLMRINELLLRDGDFSNTNEVTVIQNLRQGRPYVGCYFPKKL